jgi:hypothetical protein
VYGAPMVNVAVGNAMTPMVECLIRCGANLHIRGYKPTQSARELARDMFESHSDDAERRRIVELCGMDPDAILAERDAKVAKPGVDPKPQEALELAGDDAFRLGQSDIRLENLLFGLLRTGGLPLLYVTDVSRMDLDRFREDVKERVSFGKDRLERPKLPLHNESQQAVQAAIALATERRRETVRGVHLLHALTRDENGTAAAILARYGSSAAFVNAKLQEAV